MLQYIIVFILGLFLAAFLYGLSQCKDGSDLEVLMIIPAIIAQKGRDAVISDT